MRVAVASDLHLEFHRDEGAAFLKKLGEETRGIDVLVVAGDLATKKGLSQALTVLCNMFEHVVYVLGNHEFYGSDFDTIHTIMRQTDEALPNLHWLNRATVTIGEQRFVGCPLWFPYDPLNIIYEGMMTDFEVIKNFRNWVYKENVKDMRFLRETVDALDVVVTHYLPHNFCIAPEYRGGNLNRFFLCPMDDVFETAKPNIWIHGHTHANIQGKVNETSVYCNPFGYKGHEENAGFRYRCEIETWKSSK